jgi:hypothetical protein
VWTVPGARGGGAVWVALIQHRHLQRFRGADGRILTWDTLHGEIEVFDKRGRHRGTIDPVTGEDRKFARKGRTIRV